MQTSLLRRFPEKWRLEKTIKFLGPKVIYYSFLAILVGVSLFGAELAFAYGLQAFLLVTGIANLSTIQLAKWIPQNNLAAVLLFLVSLGIFKAALQWSQMFLSGGTREALVYLMRQRLLRWIFFSESISTSRSLALFNEKTGAAATIISTIQQMCIQFTVFFFTGLYLLWLAPKMTLAIAAFVGLLFPMIRFWKKRIWAYSQVVSREQDKIQKRVVLSIKNLLLMQIYGTQEREERLTRDSLAVYVKNLVSYMKLNAIEGVTPQALGVFVFCLIVFLSRRGFGLDSAILLSYLYLFNRCVQGFSELIKSYSLVLLYWPHTMEVAHWWADHSYDGIRNPQPIRPSSQADRADERLGWHLKGVCFSYPDMDEKVIHQLDLEFKPGQTLVISGESGVGKSTLLNLMIGGLKPTAGEITILTESGKKHSLIEYRDKLLPALGYVGADCFLFEGSVYENITYGLKDPPPREDVEKALNLAECRFVSELPKRLDHPLTEQGQGLSAGQKQRLSLARALLRNPRVLLLDEATANLDQETEARLVETLSTLKGQMTIIAVTHRQALLKIADQVLQMKRS